MAQGFYSLFLCAVWSLTKAIKSTSSNACHQLIHDRHTDYSVCQCVRTFSSVCLFENSILSFSNIYDLLLVFCQQFDGILRRRFYWVPQKWFATQINEWIKKVKHVKIELVNILTLTIVRQTTLIHVSPKMFSIVVDGNENTMIDLATTWNVDWKSITYHTTIEPLCVVSFEALPIHELFIYFYHRS